jgi:hypothetical protein
MTTLLSTIIDFPLSAKANKGFRTGLADKGGGGFHFTSALPVQIMPARARVAQGPEQSAACQRGYEATRANLDR